MKKILVPVDGSAASRKAAETAIETAKEKNAELTFIYVVYIPDLMSDAQFGLRVRDDILTLKASAEETGEKFLDKFVGELDTGYLAVKKMVVSGQPDEEIVKLAREDAFDLIIMGRRGFSRIKRFFVGSVTQRVISDSPCPVLVVLE